MKIPWTAAVLYLSAAASVVAFAQTTSPTPLTGSGVDISGAWYWVGHQDSAYETAAGALVDYGGFPLNEAGRLYALAWPASRQTIRQQQCAGYGIPYAYVSPWNYRYWEERDPYTQQLVAIHMWFQTSETRRTIWMDGRPHPPAYAAHTFPGFSTGEWKGGVLTITTTHLKRAWLRGNGVPSSDESTVVERLIRHGDRLTVFTTTTDPVFFSEPYTKTITNVRSVKDPDAWLYPCEDGEEILSRPEEQIPYFPWGNHPFLREFADKNGIPLLAVLGGADTMRPGFDLKLRDKAAADAAAIAETVPTPGRQQSSKAVTPIPTTERFTFSRCRATSICWWEMAEISPFR